jgi:hypothetical protein
MRRSGGAVRRARSPHASHARKRDRAARALPLGVRAFRAVGATRRARRWRRTRTPRTGLVAAPVVARPAIDLPAAAVAHAAACVRHGGAGLGDARVGWARVASANPVCAPAAARLMGGTAAAIEQTAAPVAGRAALNPKAVARLRAAPARTRSVAAARPVRVDASEAKLRAQPAGGSRARGTAGLRGCRIGPSRFACVQRMRVVRRRIESVARVAGATCASFDARIHRIGSGKLGAAAAAGNKDQSSCGETHGRNVIAPARAGHQTSRTPPRTTLTATSFIIEDPRGRREGGTESAGTGSSGSGDSEAPCQKHWVFRPGPTVRPRA